MVFKGCGRKWVGLAAAVRNCVTALLCPQVGSAAPMWIWVLRGVPKALSMWAV